jgi:acetyltransferase-like isoleucine patch superfamily enzyme
VGEASWLGTGALVNNNIDICARCVVGSGTVVIRNLTQPGTYVGVPARRLEK